MLEQFHPTELIDYCVAAEEAGFSGVMAADHMQPWMPQQGNAAFVWAFMAVAAERTKGDIGPGVTCPIFPPAPGGHRAGRGDAAKRCTRAGSGWAWGRARRSTSTSWPTTGRRRPSGSTGCSKRSRSSASSSPARTSSTRASSSRWRPPASGRCPLRRRPSSSRPPGPITAERTGKLCDGLITVGAPEGKIEGIFERFDKGAREAGKDPTDHAQDHPDPPVLGGDATKRRSPTR